jgi:hypothetical protein
MEIGKDQGCQELWRGKDEWLELRGFITVKLFCMSL